MNPRVLFVLVLFAIGLFLASDLWLLSVQANQARDLETIKDQFQSGQKALVAFPTVDWRFVVVFSLAGVAFGTGLGFWLANPKSGKTNSRKRG